MNENSKDEKSIDNVSRISTPLRAISGAYSCFHDIQRMPYIKRNILSKL